MFPSINIFGTDISTYTIMVLIGIIVCGLYIVKTCKNKNIDDNEIISLLLFSSIGVFVGGHLLYAITRLDLIILFLSKIEKVTSFHLLLQCLIEIFGGSVFYGGLIGGLFVAHFYMKRKKIKFEETSDLCTPIIPLFHAFGRIGCFLVGCCYGIESRFGFVYKYSPNILTNHVTRFPIQLVEAGFNLILFIVLNNLYKNNKFKGNLIYIYLISYSILRFIIEFFRGDSYRGFVFGISTSQFISIVIFIFSIVIIIVKKQKKNSKN